MIIKAAIFDLDGTITEPWFDFDAIRIEMGLGKDAGPVWEAMMQMAPEERRRAERILASHEETAVRESTLNPGAARTLSELRRRGIAIGILTRNTKANTLAVAAKHGLHFDEVYGRGEGPVKPDAFGVLELCRRFQVEPAETIVVGDYLFDLLCAKAAGGLAVWLKNHNHKQDFTEHADFTIDKLEEVLDICGNEIGYNVPQ
jgi:HAD superfamily hydrolase (TIGR01509 family)